MSTVFPKYLNAESKCKDVDTTGSEDYLAAMRKAGQIVPSILDMATGSFTASGQVETAYVISAGECNASHADNFGSKRLAIFSGNKLVLDVDANFKSSILKKTDLNPNGVDELLMLGRIQALGKQQRSMKCKEKLAVLQIPKVYETPRFLMAARDRAQLSLCCRQEAVKCPLSG